MDGCAILFGQYRLLAGQRLLLDGDKPVRLGSRAFDVLLALIERAGEVVSKGDLIARVWPTTVVEDGNLKIQVSALRRALGDGQDDNRYVITVPGRGYNFVAPIHKEELPRATPSPTMPPTVAHNLPFATTRMIGREEFVTMLVTQLSHQRLLTIVGPGGIGKTTVGLAVAERVIDTYEQDVRVVDLAPLCDPRLVPSAVATVLGLAIHTEDPLPALVAALKDNRMLLMLDNCEHVVDAAAGLVAAVLSAAPNVTFLATSREPLSVPGERLHRLGPLNSPEPLPTLTAAEAAAFPAVQLFVERVGAIVEDFALTDANAPLVAAICRKLDGLPLAIEFAAPRVEVLGVDGLAAGLDNSSWVLGTQRRAAMPRHRTMHAVLDWSYSSLSRDEQRFLRALGVFAGCFTGEAAMTVAIDEATSKADAIDRLADLVTKSLVAAECSGVKPRFRLLETTRAYVLEKLDESNERQPIAQRHAEFYRILFERAESEAAVRRADEWLVDYALEIDNLRVALDWAFSPTGNRSVGVALTAQAFPLWMRLSLLEECSSRAKRALGAFETGEPPNLRNQMRLQTALGGSTSNAFEMGAAFTKALEIAESLGDIEYQLRALRGLYFYHAGNSRYRVALPLAQTFHRLADNGSSPSDRLFGERMMGTARHFIGDQAGARRHLEQVLSGYLPSGQAQDIVRFQDIIRFGTDLRVSAHVFVARVLWLQGLPDQAVRSAELSVKEAQATGHAPSLCYALTLAACQVALWVGDLAAADRHARMLSGCARRYNLPFWSELGAKLESIVALAGDNFNAGPPLPPLGFDVIAPRNFNFLILLGEWTRAVAHAGLIAEAIRLVDRGIELSETDWLTPELFRIKGELLLSQKTPDAAETAEHLFRQAQDGARQQEILSWELRAATSLAQLLSNQGHPADASAILLPVYNRFTEGFGTADLVAAKRLLDELSGVGRG
ncbi:MAG TPA: winged helix-turn-helix domain-containing protein [Acetobacteraceae bacterium]|nr:winged helix-turn-helix domain-containing protein [Acetobacteraceae bacterium]